MTQNYDIVIIGGGIIGNSIASHLARENLKILLINSNSLGTPASIAAAGLLTPFQLSEFENPLIKDFAFKSFEYFLSFYESLKSDLNLQNYDLGFKQCGCLYLIFSYMEIPQKENELKELKTFSPKITFLNKQEIPKHEPFLTKEILGAFLSQQEGYINNPKFLKAISSYCLEKGVEFINSEVVNINISRNKIENVVLANDEKFSANKYVLCNGAWANKLLKEIFAINENILKCIKGEIVQITPFNGLPIQKVVFCKEGYILPRPATNEFETSTILVGSTNQEVSIDSSNTFENTVYGMSSLTSLFMKFLPNCKDFSITNHWTGLRPKTKDSLPILGKIREVENLYCALGHYRNGILMGPLTGKIITDIILGNSIEFNIDPFKVERLLSLATSSPR